VSADSRDPRDCRCARAQTAVSATWAGEVNQRCVVRRSVSSSPAHRRAPRLWRSTAAQQRSLTVRPEVVERGRGGLVFLSSLAGLQGTALTAHYRRSKAYLRVLGKACGRAAPAGAGRAGLRAGPIDTPAGVPPAAAPLGPAPPRGRRRERCPRHLRRPRSPGPCVSRGCAPGSAPSCSGGCCPFAGAALMSAMTAGSTPLTPGGGAHPSADLCVSRLA